MLVFVDEISPRVVYTFDLMFKDRGVAYELTNDPFVFEQSAEMKWVYSLRPFEVEYITIEPADLLFEEEVVNQRIEKAIWKELEVIAFKGTADPIASIFYSAVLYDEYISTEIDEHGRIFAKEKTLFKFGWHKQLVVERWSEGVIDFLASCFQQEIFTEQLSFNCIPTFDIDNTYAYLHKEGLRKWMSIARDILKFDKARLSERQAVLSGKLKDPYDTFDQIRAIKQKGFSPLVFWLVGDLSEFDRNLSHEHPAHVALINELSNDLEIGLHPSYKSNELFSQLAVEKNRIEEMLNRPVTKSRQHFLKMKLPYTFKHLIRSGFEHDYTIGFFDEIGFRAGIARPYLWFDLEANSVTNLQLHPFTYMDVSVQKYLAYSLEQAKEEIKGVMDEVKRFGGDFVALWHNETIGDYGQWKGWKSVLDFTLAEAKTYR